MRLPSCLHVTWVCTLEGSDMNQAKLVLREKGLQNAQSLSQKQRRVPCLCQSSGGNKEMILKLLKLHRDAY